MKLIPRYDGSGGAAKLFEYIDQFDEFASTTEYTPLMELTLAIAKLNGDAKIWWRSHRNAFPDDHSQRINCWSQLKRALIDHFTPPEHSYNIRVKLSNLKQSGSVADYNASFMRLRQQLTKISDDDVIYEYLRGLNPKIRETVRAQKDNQADLRTLQNACLRVDTTRSTSDRSTEEAHVTSVANRGGVRGQNGRRGGAHRGRGTHRQATHSRSSDSTRHPYKKNTSDKTDGPQSRSCHLCDLKDHFAGKCPDIPKIREMLISHPDQSASLAIGATIIDSGATQHMFYQLDDLSDVTQNKTTITCANSQTLRSTHMGSINLTDELNLENVLCVPDLQHNLISVRALNKSGTDVIFKSDGTVNISDDDNNNSKQIGHAIGDLFHLSTRQEEEAYLAEHSSRRTFDEYTLWHHRLGHPGRKVMRSMTQYALGLGNVQLADPINDICAGCARAKSHRQPFGSASNRSSDILGRVHTDLCGPMQTQSISGARYLLTFIDDATRYVTVYSIANKSDTFNQFVDHLTLVENQSGKSLKILRSDGGGEYINSEMRNYLAEKGIRHETTVAETPQQNGVAERYNRTILESIRAIKLSANVPDELWAELAITAAYLRNRLPTRANYNRGNISPYEAWHGNQPSIDHLRVIWADAYAHITKSKRRKLDSRSKKLKLIGYQDDKKAYRLWDQERDKVEISHDVIFDESIILNSQSTLSNIADDEYVIKAIIGEREKDDEKEYLVKWLGYDDDTWEPITHVIDTEALIEWNDRSKQHALLINCISDISIDDDPATYQEALLRPDASLWRQAIESELKSLKDNDTWSIIPHQLIPDGRQPIGCKWVFKRKLNSDGSIARYKARLVAKGYAQQFGIDYDETYAPVAKFTSIRALIAIGASHDFEMHQMDVKTAFLNGDLNEEIYMTVPEGIDHDVTSAVCKLNRTLYGLKQSPRMWNQRIDQYLINQQGFIRLHADHSLYIRRSQSELAIIALYVDDLLILSNTIEAMSKIKSALSREFEMSDCGELHQFLGIRITRDRANRRISLDQSQLANQIMSRFGMEECNPVTTPLDPSIQLKSADKDTSQSPVDQNLYRRMIGSLMYLMIGTRPDIAAAVSIISQFASNPTILHHQAAKRIIRYIKGTINLKLNYEEKLNYGDVREREPMLIGYSDANWGNDVNTRRSTTGYIFYLSGGAISWSSKRQATVALSSTEAEYMALTQATKEAIWLRGLLAELNYTQERATTLFEDNQSAIALAKNPVHHARSKHIDIQHHFIREKIESNEIEISYKSTDDMIADALTKPLARPRFAKLIDEMGLHD